MAPKTETVQNATAEQTQNALTAVVDFVEAVSRSAGYEPSLHCGTELQAARDAIALIHEGASN